MDQADQGDQVDLDPRIQVDQVDLVFQVNLDPGSGWTKWARRTRVTTKLPWAQGSRLTRLTVNLVSPGPGSRWTTLARRTMVPARLLHGYKWALRGCKWVLRGFKWLLRGYKWEPRVVNVHGGTLLFCWS